MSTVKRAKRPEKSSRTKKTKKALPVEETAELPVEELVELPVEELVEESVVDTVPDVAEVVAPVRKSLAKVTRDDVLTEFDKLLESLESEITLSRTDKNRNVSVKTLKDLKKLTTTVRNMSRKVMKAKRKSSDKKSLSGFEKPVQVSKEMSKFAGWNVNELHSRVDVTKAICQYIREHDLNNPADRRQIFPDKKLTKLLAYSAVNEPVLTYAYLMKKIQPHFN